MLRTLESFADFKKKSHPKKKIAPKYEKSGVDRYKLICLYYFNSTNQH